MGPFCIQILLNWLTDITSLAPLGLKLSKFPKLAMISYTQTLSVLQCVSDWRIGAIRMATCKWMYEVCSGMPVGAPVVQQSWNGEGFFAPLPPEKVTRLFFSRPKKRPLPKHDTVFKGFEVKYFLLRLGNFGALKCFSICYLFLDMSWF